MFATDPSRAISNVATIRGANCTRGSTVDCSQLALILRCTASTYQENLAPKFPAPGPSNPMPACAAAPGPIANDVVGTVGVPPPPYGTAFGGGGFGFSKTFDGRVTYLGGLFFSNFGIGVASGGGTGGASGGSALYNPFDSSTTRLGVDISGVGSAPAGKLPTTPAVIAPPGPPQSLPVRE